MILSVLSHLLISLFLNLSKDFTLLELSLVLAACTSCLKLILKFLVLLVKVLLKLLLDLALSILILLEHLLEVGVTLGDA